MGGQYDWTQKKYPSERPPTFPQDLADLIEGLFPEMKAEAAIVNIYSPGDTLSLHRDVSEESDKGLVSISLGCDAIFIVGLQTKRDDSSSDLNGDSNKVRVEKTADPEHNAIAVRLRSGDAVFMSREARFAWHGVPQIIPGTCPAYLEDWPSGTGNDTRQYDHWKGWMNYKRINLNVRQMRD